jgi:hypothetical protein
MPAASPTPASFCRCSDGRPVNRLAPRCRNRSSQLGDRFKSTSSVTAGPGELRLPPHAKPRRAGPRRCPRPPNRIFAEDLFIAATGRHQGNDGSDGDTHAAEARSNVDQYERAVKPRSSTATWCGWLNTACTAVVREQAEEQEARSLHLNDLVTDRVPDQIAQRTEVQLAHQVRAMRLDGLDADIECGRRFLVTLAFGQELDELSFSRGHGCVRRPRILFLRSPDVVVENEFGDLRRQKWLVQPQAVDRCDQAFAGIGLKIISASGGS